MKYDKKQSKYTCIHLVLGSPILPSSRVTMLPDQNRFMIYAVIREQILHEDRKATPIHLYFTGSMFIIFTFYSFLLQYKLHQQLFTNNVFPKHVTVVLYSGKFPHNALFYISSREVEPQTNYFAIVNTMILKNSITFKP